VGMSHYWLAAFSLAAALAVLLGLEYLEMLVSRVNEKRTYTIQYYMDQYRQEELDAVMTRLQLRYKRMLSMRKEQLIEEKYEIRGRRRHIEQLNEYLLGNMHIHEFEILSSPL